MAFAEHDPVPYYRPVAPEVPVAPREPIGDRLGGNLIAAFTQRAIASERAQIEQQQMLQRADLQAKQLAFDREQLGKNYELGSRGLDIRQQAVNNDYDIADRRLGLDADLEDLKAEHMRQQIEALKVGTDLTKTQMKTAFQRNLAFAEEQGKFLQQAGKDADELGLFKDPQVVGPMIYAKNALGFEKLYEGTSDPKLKATIKMFKDKAESSKVTLKTPAGGTQTYPWSQVVQDLERNGDNSEFFPMLKRSGLMQSEDITTEIAGKKVPGTALKFGPFLKKNMEESLKGNPIKQLDEIKSKADPFAPRNATEAIAAGTLNAGNTNAVTPPPNPVGTKSGRLDSTADIPPPEKSAAEIEADYVKQKIATDPANADAYKKMFFDRNPGRTDLLQ